MPIKQDSKSATRKLEQAIKTTRMIATASLAIGVIAIMLALIPLVSSYLQPTPANFGHTLAGINNPFTPAQLAVINNASSAYFETAGEMYLNHSLTNVGTAPIVQTNALIVNGKPSIIYLGAISCIFCGENRWAMALALGQLGHFGSIYKGYSALQDGDVPTIYWQPARYNVSSGVSFGSNYSSAYLNFVPIEYESQISQGFQIQPLTYFQQQAAAYGNPTYISATNVIVTLNSFQGTPYTIWGRDVVSGADAIAMTNGTTSLMNMSHADVLRQLAKPNNLFAWEQYAGADLYIAMACASLSGSMPPICSLPAIKAIQKTGGY
ncbi:MAG: DUF929 family protein [Candidatus Micrarchaeota archaeon]|nr:DUF929 family protein [Candidatus Micrarchaeota archaeon]